MGWTYTQKPDNVSQWFKESLTWETKSAKNTCLKTAIKFKEAYAAVETVIKATGERYVWGAAFMLNYTRDYAFNFGYKDMDETMGPNISNCPLSILDLLTPTDNEWANKWRKECRRRASIKPIRFGDKVKFLQPIYGCNDTVFEKIRYGRCRNIFKSDSGRLIRLPKRIFNSYEWEIA